MNRPRGRAATGGDATLANEITQCQNVLKGYGETHGNASRSFASLMGAARKLQGRADAADTLAELRPAALADDEGKTLPSTLVSAGLGDQPTG